MKPFRALLVVLAGCATTQSATVGYSLFCATPASSASIATSASPSASPFLPPTLQSVGSAFLSRGHLFARYQATISVTDFSSNAYGELGPGQRVPDATIITERLQSPDDSITFVMRKMGGEWYYFQYAPPAKQQPMLHPCIDCHAQRASQDCLFGHP